METVVRTIIGYLWIKSCWNKSSWSMSSFSAIPHPGDKSNNFCFVCSSNEFGASVFRCPYGDGYFSDVIWRLMDLWELGKKVLSFRICKRLPLMKHVFVSLFSFFFYMKTIVSIIIGPCKSRDAENYLSIQVFLFGDPTFPSKPLSVEDK